MKMLTRILTRAALCLVFFLSFPGGTPAETGSFQRIAAVKNKLAKHRLPPQSRVYYFNAHTMPAFTEVQYGASHTMSITWDVPIHGGPLNTVSSSSGIFCNEARDHIAEEVHQVLSTDAHTGVSVVFVETITISPAVMEYFSGLGLQEFFYFRRFEERDEYSYLISETVGALRLWINFPYVPPPPVSTIDVTTSPIRSRVALGRSAMIPVSWMITGIPASAFGTQAVSTGGTFVSPDNLILKTYAQGLSRRITGPRLTFSESVLVSGGLIYEAHKRGYARFSFRRTFAVGADSIEAGIDIDITGGAGGAFAVSRLSLGFEDWSPLKFINEGGKVQVAADIAYSGSGLLSAAWELADPLTTVGSPAYRTIKSENLFLAGQGRTRIEGPPLPTDAAGLYLVRLRLVNPPPAGEIPVVRYFVNPVAPRKAMPAPTSQPQPIRISLPSTGFKFIPGTTLDWDAIPGSRAYQVEIYRKEFGATAISHNLLPPGTSNLVAGMVVPGDQTKAALSSMSGKRLKPNQAYLWRILAIGEGGQVIGASHIEEFRTP